MAKKIPTILILGRPNVGKSTLINRLIGRKKAITYDQPGVTRDLAEYRANWHGTPCVVVDSGGVFFSKSGDIYLQDEVESRVSQAIQKAHRIIFLTDIKDGLHPLDGQIGKILRPVADKTVVVVNKMDNKRTGGALSDFYRLGLGEPVPISSSQGTGVAELMDQLLDGYMANEPDDEDTSYKVAIVGRPNVGKSSLVNAILNEDRMIVDSVAGTTRDAVELSFKTDGKQFVFIDTAGLRKKARVRENIEFYSTVRSQKSIEEADLVVVVLDATDFMRDQDKKILNLVQRTGRSMILFINKWDQTDRTGHVRSELMERAIGFMPSLEYFPFIFGSATQKINIGKLFKLIPEVIKSGELRISTGQLNRFADQVIMNNPPPAKNGKLIKIYYVTQAESAPPVFVFFANYPKLIEPDYLRFLERRLRNHLDPFYGNPVKIFFKGRKDTD